MSYDTNRQFRYYLQRETYENNPAWHWCFCNDVLIHKRAIEHFKSYSSLRPNGTAIENVIMRDPSKSYLVERHLGGVFKCSWPLLQKLNKSGFPTVRRSCFTQSSELMCQTHQDIDWSTFAFERTLCLFQIRKRGMRCRSSNPRVVKTIRLRRAGLEPWLYQTNIKVPIRNMTNMEMVKWLKD